ncbi:mRNA-decapping enzyme 1B isoform X2 [Sorex araneus]|uniref:mRNA-decapping enzyme 1B isoform X2 n=1 Tax=Sorex araneus TaxID=42254 RepID=UPI0024338E5C|nr:mRNA-decapping enzyme 1B isoform X2 [Sorex araneus]
MAAAGGPLGKGRDISLAALQRHDPYINRIVDVASQVALYTFGHRANEWEKTDVEGTLFVYTRSASPKHGFTIMNRLSMENRTEPITKDLDFQLQDPFLLYRNARLSIYGIWFYDKEECQRIAELMKNLTQHEQLKAHQSAGAGVSPVVLSSGEGKEVDILRMLTKAKDEYTKCKTCSEPKQITSSSAIYDNPNLIKPIPVKPSENQQHRIPQASQTFDPEPQHLSLTALFGKQDKAVCQEIPGRPPTLQQQQQEKLVMRQGVVRALSYEEPGRHSPPLEKQLCPAIQKLMVRSTDLHPLSELSRNGHLPPAVDGVPGSRQPESPRHLGTCQVPSASRTQHLAERLQRSPGAPTKQTPCPRAPAGLCRTLHSASSAAPEKARAPSQLLCLRGAFPLPAAAHGQAHGQEPCAGQSFQLTGSQAGGPGVVSPRELLRKLQMVQQEQQLHAPPRPALAAKFPTAAHASTAGKPLEPWMDRTPGTEQQAPLSQVISPQRGPAAAAPSLLMSPMVFTHGPAGPLKERSNGLLPLGSQDLVAAPAGLLLPLHGPEPALVPGSALTKRQLQEALLDLIQNDDNFLNIIYEAYLLSMTQAAVKKPL